MTSTDFLAWLGAITGTAALIWDIIKWIKRGARLKVTAAPNMEAYGTAAHLLGAGKFVFVEANNVGDGKTTITHLVGYYYSSRWQVLRRKATRTLVVPDPSPGRIPHVIDSGERWVGTMEQNDELAKMSQEGYLYVGVLHSNAKRPVTARVIIRD